MTTESKSEEVGRRLEITPSISNYDFAKRELSRRISVLSQCHDLFSNYLNLHWSRETFASSDARPIQWSPLEPFSGAYFFDLSEARSRIYQTSSFAFKWKLVLIIKHFSNSTGLPVYHSRPFHLFVIVSSMDFIQNSWLPTQNFSWCR